MQYFFIFLFFLITIFILFNLQNSNQENFTQKNSPKNSPKTINDIINNQPNKNNINNLPTQHINNLPKRNLFSKNDKMNITLRTKNTKNENINKIHFENPVRLNLPLPNYSINPELSNSDVDMNNNNNNNSNNNNNQNTNEKIKYLVKKSAELSYLALENKEPIDAFRLSNYALAYLTVLQEIYTENEIEKATNVNLYKLKNELLEIQNSTMSKLQKNNTNSNKDYLLNIISSN